MACPFWAAHLPASSTRSLGPSAAAAAGGAAATLSLPSTAFDRAAAGAGCGGRRLELTLAFPWRSSLAPLIREPTSPEELDLLLLPLLEEEGPDTEE